MSEVSTITVNRTELGNALTFAQLGLSKRPAVPVLAGMLVTHLMRDTRARSVRLRHRQREPR